MAAELQLQNMSIQEKMQIMELLWNDLCKNAESLKSPDWHKDILDKRLKTIENPGDYREPEQPA